MTDFKRLPVEELKALAEYYVIDVVAAKEDKPTKKELLLAFDALQDDDVISEEDYAAFKSDYDRKNAEPESIAPKAEEKSAPAEPVDTSDWVLIKFTGNNPTLEILNHTFRKRHPYQLVSPEVAEILVIKHEGFRMALPSEVNDYYN